MSAESTDNLSPRQRLDRACADLRGRLRRGEDCHAEEYLAAYPSLGETDDRAAELILTEFIVRQQLGQTPQPEEWLDRFPRWRDRLKRAFAEDGGRLTATVAAATEAAPGTCPTPIRPGPGSIFGRYELLGRLGKGGMGIVFRAWDPALGRTVALKMIRDGAFANDADVERFDREARAAARLQHPNIVALHDVGESQGQRYFTMALAEGCLHQTRERFRDPRAAAALVEKVARAVHYAHEKGVIHRDLKPGNVLLDERGEPLVADFGLARFADAPSDLTRTGEHLGTLAYMAPEQLVGRSHEVTERIDTWALGVILFELLTGERPFKAGDSEELRRRILVKDPPDPVKLIPTLDPGLRRIVLKCLEKEPTRRYPNARALADDLRNWLDGRPVAARPQSRLRRVWRRRRGLVTALIGGLVLAITIGIVAFALAPWGGGGAWGGSRVVLIGDTGRPAYSEWVVRAGGEVKPQSNDGAFTISAVQPSVLRLVRTPGRSYHLSALVRHNRVTKADADVPGEIGLGFALSSQETPQGSRQVFCTWAFNDYRLFTDPNEGKPYGVARLRIRSYGGRAEVNHPLHEQRFQSYRDMPQDQTPPFRLLGVTVTPEWIQLFWDGQPVVKVERTLFDNTFDSLKQNPVLNLDPTLKPEFGPEKTWAYSYLILRRRSDRLSSSRTYNRPLPNSVRSRPVPGKTHQIRILSPRDCDQLVGSPTTKNLFAHVCISPDLVTGETAAAILIVKAVVEDPSTHVKTTINKPLPGKDVTIPGGSVHDRVFWFDLSQVVLVKHAIWKIDVCVKLNADETGHASSLLVWRGPEKTQVEKGGAKGAGRPVAYSSGAPHEPESPHLLVGGHLKILDVDIGQPSATGGSATVGTCFQALGFVDPSPCPVYSYIRKVSDPSVVLPGNPCTPIPFPYNWGFEYDNVPVDNNGPTAYVLTVMAFTGGGLQIGTLSLTVTP